MTAAKKKKKSSSSKTTTSNDGKEKEELDDSSTAEALPRIEGDPTVDVSSEDVIGEDKRADDAFEEGGAADSLEEEEVVAVSEIPRPKKKKGRKSRKWCPPLRLISRARTRRYSAPVLGRLD